MATKTAEVLATVMNERGLSQTDIARAIGVSPQSVQQWSAGKTSPKGKNLEALAEYLKLPPATILMGNYADRFTPSTVDLEGDVVSIPLFETKAACSPTGYENAPNRPIVSMVRATSQWLRAKCPTVNMSHLEIINATGDSMSPTIHDLDFVMVDRTYQDVRGDGVYVVSYAGDTFIKRVQRTIDGGLLLVSDNKKYAPLEVPPDRLDLVVIEGKCVIHCSVSEI